MRVVALVSGGKDSTFAMQLCREHGHELCALANLLPAATGPAGHEEVDVPDELDSFCFQTVSAFRRGGNAPLGSSSAPCTLPTN
jgi:diphthine-ammonia ligase